MTRLIHSDIGPIASGLEIYNRQLKKITGKSMLGIACHAAGVEESLLQHRINSFDIRVVPVTAGQGTITDFSETITRILQFLGFSSGVTDQTDVSGLCRAYESKADAVMMADDLRFVGIHLQKRRVIDNSEATGRVFAAALDLMTQGEKNLEILIMGCGPVGESAARTLLSLDFNVALYDTDSTIAESVKKRLAAETGRDRIMVAEKGNEAVLSHPYILEATPSMNTIRDEQVPGMRGVAAPGVPSGVSKEGCEILKDRLIHDKLELGVAAMAVSLLLSS